MADLLATVEDPAARAAAETYLPMTLEQLEAEFRATAAELITVSEKRRVLAGLIEQRKREAGARARIIAMPALEKDALRTILNEDAAKVLLPVEAVKP